MSPGLICSFATVFTTAYLTSTKGQNLSEVNCYGMLLLTTSRSRCIGLRAKWLYLVFMGCLALGLNILFFQAIIPSNQLWTQHSFGIWQLPEKEQMQYFGVKFKMSQHSLTKCILLLYKNAKKSASMDKRCPYVLCCSLAYTARAGLFDFRVRLSLNIHSSVLYLAYIFLLPDFFSKAPLFSYTLEMKFHQGSLGYGIIFIYICLTFT